MRKKLDIQPHVVRCQEGLRQLHECQPRKIRLLIVVIRDGTFLGRSPNRLIAYPTKRD